MPHGRENNIIAKTTGVTLGLAIALAGVVFWFASDRQSMANGIVANAKDNAQCADHLKQLDISVKKLLESAVRVETHLKTLPAGGL